MGLLGTDGSEETAVPIFSVDQTVTTLLTL